MRRSTAVSSLFLMVSMAAAFVPAAHAAVTPSLGAAATYAVLAGTFTNTIAGTTINGDIGFTTGPAVAPVGTHVHYGPGAPYAAAGTAQGTTLSSLAAQPCTFNFAPGAINLSTETTHGPIGVYTPGVYCSVGAMNVGGPLHLNGNGTYIFRANGALTSTAGSIVTVTGASACNVFWTPTEATTLAANTTFAGIIIDNAGITVGANTTWIGMALAFGGTVTTDTDTMTVCTAASSSPSSSSITSSSALSSSVPMSSSPSSFSSLSSFSSSSSLSSSRSSSTQTSSASSSARSVTSSSVRSSSSASSAPSSARSVIAPPAPFVLPPAPTPLLPKTGVGPDAAITFESSLGSFLEDLSSLLLHVYRNSLKGNHALDR